MHVEERIRQRDTCKHQEGNGEAADGKVGTQSRIEFSHRTSSRSGKGHPGAGIVNKIIASLRTIQPEKAQIAVAGTDDRYRDLRIENSLSDGNGNEVSLKKGAVEVTITARPNR